MLNVKVVPRDLLFVGDVTDPVDEDSAWLHDAYEYISKNLVEDYFTIAREFYWGDDEFIIYVTKDIAHYLYDTTAEINKVIDYSLSYNVYGK